MAQVIDLETGEERFTFPHTQSVLDLAFSPDDILLLSGSFEGPANLYDTESGDLVRSLEGSPGGIGLFVDFTPDGQHILLNLVSQNRITRLPVTIDSLIEEMCGRVLRDLTGEERDIYNVDESPTCTKFTDES